MKYFITGATGFIGSRVAAQLRQAGHEVIALVRKPSQAKDLADIGVKLAEGDIVDKESMRAPMTGVDGVFHIAGWYKVGTRNQKQGEAINVDGTRNVLEMMRDLKIKKGVYTSTVAIFGDTHGDLKDENYVFQGKHVSKYAETKWRAHHEVAVPMVKAGLPLVIVQPGVVIGPDDPSVIGEATRMYLRGALPLIGQKNGYNFTHVNDQARGIILAMEKGKVGESYILGGPAYTMVDYLKLAQKISGIRPPLIQAPPALMSAMAVLQDITGVIIPWPQAFAGETLRSGAGVTNMGSSAKAERELGWTPRPLEQGLRLTLEHELKKMGKSLPAASQ
jgi:nucleoside-diphosphate-sugar epimerase